MRIRQSTGQVRHVTEDLHAISYVRRQPHVNTLRPRQNGRHFADDIFKRIFMNENVRILIKLSLKFIPKGPINNIQALVQIMAWRWPGDKPLSEPMLVSLLTHICVTRPQWVKTSLCHNRAAVMTTKFQKQLILAYNHEAIRFNFNCHQDYHMSYIWNYRDNSSGLIQKPNTKES